MNPIQKGWIRAFKPVMSFWNNNLCKRPGMMGRIARFFRFGPREYGVHPSTNFMRFMNAQFLQVYRYWVPNVPVMRHMSQRGLYIIRPMWAYAYIGYIFAIGSLFGIFLYGENGLENDSLRHAMSGAGSQVLPVNSLEDRKSAHYMEISRFYEVEMQQLMEKKYNEIAFERLVEQSDLTRSEKNKLNAFSKAMINN